MMCKILFKTIKADKAKISFLLISLLLISSSNLFSKNTENPDIRINKAKELLTAGDFIGASIILKEIIETSKERSNIGLAHKIRGDIYRDIFEYYERASAEYNKALTFPLDENSVREIHSKLDKILLELRNYKRDKKDYSKEEIRVALRRGKEFRVTSKGGVKIYLLPNGDCITFHNEAKVSASEKGININSKDLSFLQIKIEPVGNHLMTLDGKCFRGKLIVLKDNKELLVINQLNIEDYLYGVIPKEINPNWPIEALKAQAIVSRSYALFKAKINKDKPFDLDATKFSQAYGGFNSENKKSNNAVDQTRGKVLTYKDKLVLAYFHSNSGGYLEDSENIWGIDLPYFEEIPDEFSKEQPGYSWSYKMNLRDLASILNDNGIKVGSINEIIPSEKGRYGRIIKISISHSAGNLLLNGNTFRLKVGPYKIKSTLCKIKRKGDVIEFSGRGFGHGVGMSQWGAYIMAKKGYSYQEILAFYYKGIEVR